MKSLRKPKGLIRIRKSNKERQDNSQMKRDNKTNNGRQNNTQKTKHLVTQTLLKQRLNSDAPEGLKVPVLLGVLQFRLQVMNDELLDDKQQSINLLPAFDFRLEFATSIFLLSCVCLVETYFYSIIVLFSLLVFKS